MGKKHKQRVISIITPSDSDRYNNQQILFISSDQNKCCHSDYQGVWSNRPIVKIKLLQQLNCPRSYVLCIFKALNQAYVSSTEERPLWP